MVFTSSASGLEGISMPDLVGDYPDIGFILTPMMESIVMNCEYPGCEVEPLTITNKVPLPDSVLTDRVRLACKPHFKLSFKQRHYVHSCNY